MISVRGVKKKMGILNDELNRIHHEMAKIADKYFGEGEKMSDRLISADALLKEAMEDGAYGYVDAEQIANAPTIDAVTVVRCKECKWQKEIYGYYRCLWWQKLTGPEVFCSIGERREDETD